jgi:hypothetical protein
MNTEYTIFGRTAKVPLVVYLQNKKIDSDCWDETLWIERGEDWYALMSSKLKNKKVRVIERDIWIRNLYEMDNNVSL